MKVKLKECSICGKESIIWKSHEKLKYCKYCWYKKKPPKHINNKSKKRIEQDKIYMKLREIYLRKHPICEVDNISPSTEIHHTYSGKDRETHFLDVGSWMAVCRKSHDWIHTFPIDARKLNYLK